MNAFAELPVWVATIVAFFIVLSGTLTLLGCVGLVTLRSFYDRLHAPTLGTSWGTAGLILAAMIFFTVLEQRFVVHTIVIGIFVMITTPVTLMVVGRAALQRDRAEGNDVPAALTSADQPATKTGFSTPDDGAVSPVDPPAAQEEDPAADAPIALEPDPSENDPSSRSG